ncbi:MAG TPA: ATP-binding cassette domain-containing protein [Candidatus Choladousia intestinigallinarum]|nr:ATP-binding cassette domain-containing protein [Candidatus Choladousia intestinigallinarum]
MDREQCVIEVLHVSKNFKNVQVLMDVSLRCESGRIYGLDPGLRRPVGKYSLGMRQRFALAQAIMEDPKILILDEPMNGLDKNGVKEIRELLLEMKKQNKLILLASHNREDIQVLCDEVYEMEDGKLRKLMGQQL